MPTPAYNQNQRKNAGLYFGPTRGRAVPHLNRRACLCVDSDTYSRACCEGALQNQSIGATQGPYNNRRGAFSSGFSNGFDIGNI